MREWWANVYPFSDKPGWHWVGREWRSRERAVQAAATDPQIPTCRIHVLLKPEGAPQRYASEANRRAWEKYPTAAKASKAVGVHMCVGEGGAMWVYRFAG